MERLLTALISVLLGMVTIIVLNASLAEGSEQAMLLISKPGAEPVWISEQAVMWLFFYLGLGELILRILASNKEELQIRRKLLPEDESVMLVSADLPSLYGRAKHAGDAYLPRMVRRIIRQFQVTKSSGQANGILDSSMELFLHEIDLNYNMLRYIMWVIPTIGFIGTVRGIAAGLNRAAIESHQGNSDDLLYVVSMDLGVAFYTTMLALVMSGVLVLIMHIAQGREERALNRSGQYCIDFLINKLYNPTQR